MHESSGILEVVKGTFVNVKVLGKQEKASPSGDIASREIVRSGIEEYLASMGGQPFQGKDVGIIVNDRNRPTPTHLVLEELIRQVPGLLERIGRVHIATGTHEPPSRDDIGTILGGTYEELSGRVHIHRSKEEDEHEFICTTSRGTELRVDRAALDHDLLIMINSVEPHYFAGFTGGRKSILPGISWYGTVEMNHSHALDPGSRTLALEGNPVHEDMEEAVSVFLGERRHITFQLVQAPGIILSDMFIGDIFTAFREGVELAKRNFCRTVEAPFDVVITVAAPPMDRTLYQAQKAIENGKIALRDAGIILLAASCGEGIGNPVFWDLLTSEKDASDVLAAIEKGYRLGYHKAAKIAQLSERAEIIMVSEIPSDILARGFIRGFGDMGEALGYVRERMGADASVLVIEDGTVTVPMIEES